MPSANRDPHDVHFHREVLPILTSDSLYRYIVRKVHDDGDAEEIAQRTAVRAWAFRHHLTLGVSPKGWVYVIARHEVYRLLSERRCQRYHDRSDVDVDDLVYDGVSVEDACDQVAELRKLESAIGQLPREKRETAKCRYLLGMSNKDTAARLRIPEGTAMSRSFRARASLRELLAPASRC